MVVRCLVALGIGRVGFVMIVERQYAVLLIDSGEHIDGVTVIALGQLFQKAETSGQGVIGARVEIQVQSLCQREEPRPPFTRGDGTVNCRHDDQSSEQDKYQDKTAIHDCGRGQSVLGHPAGFFLTQSRRPGHYNF